MPATLVFAGECTATFESENDVRASVQRGRVVVLVKPDDTVLVHDADGYQPVAWLTRPEALTVSRPGVGGDAIVETSDDGDAPEIRIEARDGDQRLRVALSDLDGEARYPAGEAGVPVGPADRFVRTRGAVVALDGGASYPVPSDATVLDRTCDCGLPLMAVERGVAVEVCVDRDCDPLDEAVRAALDREWACPDCESDLRILRRGGLLAGCDAYPDCETAFSLPRGVVDGECRCGLPAFETGDGRRCLDATCEELRAGR